MPWKLFPVVFLLLHLPLALTAQEKGRQADDIVGTYEAYNPATGETLHLNFYKADDESFEARIVWMDEPLDDLGKPRTDVQNPRAELRRIPLSHLVIVRKLRHDSRGREWTGGRVYDPMTGKTYRCAIAFEGEDTLRVRAYIGFRFLGRTLYWKRVP